uniref:Putative ribonucleoside diphosphate reductase n=1 Tax=viral metagenome TaxID=1070528 RepID=A0A6M3JXP2_9ZZZZ
MNELSENAKSIFEKLYSFSGESIDDTFRRVAREFANSSEEEELAYSLQKNNIWRPNTPAYLNAGTKHKIFSACYCVDLEDSMESIYDIASVAMRIFKCGAGIGIPIGNLREAEAYIYEGEPDHAPEGKSSGPLVFLKLYDAVGDTTKSGGRVRRAAILCDMQVSHPDIMNFIRCKEIDGRLANMNISVAITDDFMKALKDNIPFSLITPYDGSKVGEVDPSNLWSNLVEMNWRTADPGVIFIDIVNKYNVLKKRYTIKVLNPCITGDTLISTINGDIRIDELTGKEKILTYNIKNGLIDLDDIEFVGKTRIDVDTISIEMEDGEILNLTPDHPVYTENRGYVMASDLNENDVLLMLE